MLYCVTIDNKMYEVAVERGDAAIVSTTEIAMGDMKNKKLVYIQTAATTTAPNAVKSTEQTIKASQGIVGEVIKAPMAGAIMDIKVSIGSAVKKGDTLLLLEAMKMENEITAYVDGIIAEIKAVKGAYVSAGDVLIVLQ